MNIETIEYVETELRKAEISDIFFNYGAVSYLYVNHDSDWRSPEQIRTELLEDAKKLLDMLLDKSYTPSQLVTNFLGRL